MRGAGIGNRESFRVAISLGNLWLTVWELAEGLSLCILIFPFKEAAQPSPSSLEGLHTKGNGK